MSADEEYDRNRSVNADLTEVRTVLERAKTARRILHYHQVYNSDAEKLLMDEALHQVIELLLPWERHGRTKRKRR